LFFCLSGFLIGRLLLDIQHRNPSAKAVRVFLIRRWIRTLPLYYFTLIAFLAFPQIEPSTQQRVWSYVLLLQNLITPMPNSNWFGPSWSLTIEEWSYLALPFLAFYICRSTRNPIASAALILAGAGIAVRFMIGLAHGPWNLGEWDVLIRKMVISRSDAVVYGVLAAIFADHYSRMSKWALPLAAGLLGWNIWTCYYFEHIPGVVGWLLLFPLTAMGFALLLPWLAELPTPARFTAPIHFLARISYALYLVHWPFIFFAAALPEKFRLVVYFGGSVLVATILSYVIEYPIMRLRPKQV
jgi:peptidoglycan/LPS O-acetylase OafA/YrhL